MSAFSERLAGLISTEKAAQLKEGTPSEAVRIDRLKLMERLLVENLQAIAAALSADFGNRSFDHTLIELWSTIVALRFNQKHVGEWMKAEVREPAAPEARAFVGYVPKGVVRIMGPWDVPYYLTLIHWPVSLRQATEPS